MNSNSFKMDTISQPQKPEPTLQQPHSMTCSNDSQSSTQNEHTEPEHFDPCENAQKFSPFYMYNHDSPRPSTDLRPKQSIHVSVRDLELGDITPSVTQEKMDIQKQPKRNMLQSLKFWEKPRQQSLTRPKKQIWLQRLPKKQRIAVRAAIALLVVGTMIGIAVGIAAALDSGVYGSNKTVGEHNNQ